MKTAELENALAGLPEDKLAELVQKVRVKKRKTALENFTANIDVIAKDIADTLKNIEVPPSDGTLKCMLTITHTPKVTLYLGGSYETESDFELIISDVEFLGKNKKADLKKGISFLKDVIYDALYDYQSIFNTDPSAIKKLEKAVEYLAAKIGNYGLDWNQKQLLVGKLKKLPELKTLFSSMELSH